MSIKKYYTTTFAVTRQTWIGDSSSLVSQDSFDGHIQQGSNEDYEQYTGLRFTKAFTIYCSPDTDVQEADRLTQGSNSYDVRFVIDRNIGNQGHLMVIVEKVEE